MAKAMAYFKGDTNPVRDYLEGENIRFEYDSTENVVYLPDFDVLIRGLDPSRPHKVLPNVQWVRESKKAAASENKKIFNQLKKKFGEKESVVTDYILQFEPD